MEYTPIGDQLKVQLRHILEDKGQEYLNRFGREMRAVEQESLGKMLVCGSEENGFQSYFCAECEQVHRMTFSCKTRLCPRCGRKANERFAEKFVRRMLPVTHRHVVFTLPDVLWGIFHENVVLLKGMLKAASNALKRMMSMYVGREVVPGCMAVLHNSGRDLKSNCHDHLIVTEGGVDRDGNWVKFTYFPFEKKGGIHTTLNELWQEEILELLRTTLPRTRANALLLQELKDRYPFGFYVNAPNKNRIKTGLNLRRKAKYITRYVKHPVISDSRIIEYNGSSVKFWYDHPSTKERRIKVMDVWEFIGAVLGHLPEKNFRAVVYYGLYSPNYPQKAVFQTIFTSRGDIADPLTLGWRENAYLRTGRDPIRCTLCGCQMDLVSAVYRKNGGPIVCYYLSIYDRMAMNYPDKEMWLMIDFPSFAR